MDIFTQKKLLVRIVVFMVILNCIMMGALLWKDFFHRIPGPENTTEAGDVSRILERELKLTHEQATEIRRIRDEFAVKEQDLETKIKSARDSMNSIMFSASAEDDLVKVLARHVAENEFNMEILRLEQANAIKAVCNKEQLDKFESLMQELREYLKAGNRQEQDNKQGRERRPPKGNKQKKDRGPERK